MTVTGQVEEVTDPAAVAALCAAVQRAVQAHHHEGLRVREVIVMLEDAGSVLTGQEATPVYVDVYDSGYGHGI